MILRKFNNINYHTICTQEARKLHIYYFLSILFAKLVVTYVIHVVHYFGFPYIHKIMLYLTERISCFYPSNVPHPYNRLGKHLSLSKLFWKYVFAYSMRYLSEPDCFLGI